MWKFHNQKLITNADLLTSKWATTREVTFHTEIWFRKPDTLWLTYACVRRHSALKSKLSGQYQRDDFASAKQILPKNQQNYKHVLHFDGSWSTGVHFRWSRPLFFYFSCMVGGSSAVHYVNFAMKRGTPCILCGVGPPTAKWVPCWVVVAVATKAKFGCLLQPAGHMES